MKTISMRDANQGFSRVVREVEAGEEFTITRDGTPIAKLSPIPGRRVLTPEQQAAMARTKAFREEGWNLGSTDAPFDRDSLYDD